MISRFQFVSRAKFWTGPNYRKHWPSVSDRVNADDDWAVRSARLDVCLRTLRELLATVQVPTQNDNA